MTKADKIKVLELSVYILEDKHRIKASFMCVAIESAASELGLRDEKNACELIPELLKYKPSDKKHWNCWFPVEEREKRINILKEVIKNLNCNSELNNLIEPIIKNVKPLDDDFSALIDDNFWDLV